MVNIGILTRDILLIRCGFEGDFHCLSFDVSYVIMKCSSLDEYLGKT